MKHSIITFCFLLLTSLYFNLSSQNISDEGKANEYLRNKNEVYFKFNINSKREIKTLTQIISIANVKDKEVYAYANSKEFQKFKALKYNYQVLPHPGDVSVQMYKPSKSIWQFDTYPTYTDYLMMMSTFESNYPNQCKIVNIGTTLMGRQMLCAKLSDSVNTNRKVPRFFYLAAMHGNETTGYVLMLHLIDYLLSNYGTDARITQMLDSNEVWIMPCTNPDGTYHGGNNSVTNSTRYNANGIDINRNFPNPVGGNHPDGNAWEGETMALMHLADSLHFVMSCSFHTGEECVNYPWDSWDSSTKIHADDAWWQFVSHEYADTVLANSIGYMQPSGSSFYNGVTNGGDWYVVYGSHQDYLNYYKNSRAITIEISNTFTPAASSLPTYWNYNYKSFLNFIEQQTYGIKGTVTNACTGQPLVAKIVINNHDIDSSWVYSDSIFGDYYRPIDSGSYSMTITAAGYLPMTINNINVTYYNSTIINVRLNPTSPTVDFVADKVSSCNGTINFANHSTQALNSLWHWDFGDGNTDTTSNPIHSYSANGTYTVILTDSNCVASYQNIKTNYITINRPSSPVTFTDSTCGAGTVNLTANGSGKLNWYNSNSGGAIINTGTSFTTPALTTTTTYYVENEVANSPVYVAKPNNTGGGSYSTSSSHYLIFNCYTPVTLISVDVYANSTGNRAIELRNNIGTILDSVTINISSIGLNTLTLNFSLPIDSNLQLGLSPTSASDLFFNNVSTAISYPYTTSGLISVKGCSAGNGFYYYFYNWQILEPSCLSLLSPVTAIVNQMYYPNISINTLNDTICRNDSAIFTATISNGGTSPSYQWQVNGSNVSNSSTFASTSINNNDTVSCILTSSLLCVSLTTDTSNNINIVVNSTPLPAFSNDSGSHTVNFTNSTINGTTYYWDFGDSTYSSLDNPTHTYAQNGTYNVKLIATNSCGADSITIPIIVLYVGISNQSAELVKVYPNPVKNILNIKVSKSIQSYTLHIYDVYRRIIITKEINSSNYSLDVSSLSNNVYFYEINTTTNEYKGKFVILR